MIYWWPQSWILFLTHSVKKKREKTLSNIFQQYRVTTDKSKLPCYESFNILNMTALRNNITFHNYLKEWQGSTKQGILSYTVGLLLGLPSWTANNDSTQPCPPSPRCQTHAPLWDCPSANLGSPLAYYICLWRRMFGTLGLLRRLLRQSMRQPLLFQLEMRGIKQKDKNITMSGKLRELVK